MPCPHLFHIRAASLSRAGVRPCRILTWSKAAQNLRADGFKPNTEAIGERQPQLKAIEKALPRLAAQANIVAQCEKGTLSYDTLQEPHASRAKRLSKTKVVGALSSGAGSAVGFVSHWKAHISIDDCAIVRPVRSLPRNRSTITH